MKHCLSLALGFALLLLPAGVHAADPVVSNVTFAQRAGTKLVDITYDVMADTPTVFVSLEISSDGGTTFSVPATAVSGAIGAGVAIGTERIITWDAGADWSGQYSARMRFKVTASDIPPPVGFSLIPAGGFTMGDTLDGDTNAPTRTVTLSGFYMSQKEVSKAEWDAVRTWAVTNGYTDLAAGDGKATNHPVQTVSWCDVIKWCNARSEKEGLTPCYTVSGAAYQTGNGDGVACNWRANGYRLPTEAEWEKAARGGLSGKRFPWGDTISHTQANYFSTTSYSYDISPTRGFYGTDGYPYSSPVGSFAANGYGLYDMAGNTWEWCWDGYDTYASGTQTNPRGSASVASRVVRGGGASSGAQFARCAHRTYGSPPFAYAYCSFRVARSSVPATDAGSGYAISADEMVDTRYKLTSLAPTNGTISGVVADGNYLTGTTATLTAVPAAGYAFTGWTGDASGIANPLSLLMDTDKTIGATFTRQYTLTASAVSNGTISGIVAGGNYLTGTSATLTAVPAVGYVFTGWTGNATGTDNPLSLLIDADKTIGANFTRQYTLTISALNNGSIGGIAADGKYLTGTTAALTAVPVEGFVFTGWTGAASGTTNPLSLVMNSDKTIGATYVRGIEVLVDGQLPAGSEVVRRGSLKVTMQTAFVNGTILYTLDGSEPSLDSNLYTTALPISRSCTVRAVVYSSDFSSQMQSSPLSVVIVPVLTATTAGGGSISVEPPEGAYSADAMATLTATPAAGWTFLQWLGDANGTNPVTSVQMTRNKTVQAVFGTAVNTTTVGSGTIWQNPVAAFYPYGTRIRFSGLPASGNYLAFWGNAVTSTDNPLDFTVTQPNQTVTAVFQPLAAGQFALALVAEGGGKVAATPAANRYSSGASVRVTAQPGLGQAFIGWSGDAAGSTNPLTVEMNQSKTITAVFTKLPQLRVDTSLEGIVEDGFRLTLTGEFGKQFEILGSADLVNWIQAGTLTNVYGTSQFTDGAATNQPRRFYRAAILNP